MSECPTRRSVLSGASLAGVSLACVSAPGAGAAPGLSGGREVVPPTGDTICVRQFGSVGDGQFHPLSSRFVDLAAARAAYPKAGDLAESLDGAAIQAAIDHASRLGDELQLRRRVHLPAGRYPLSRSLRLPSNVILFGDGIDASIIDNQNKALAAPVIVNADPDAASMTLHDLSLHGGTHGVRIDVRRYVDGYEFLRVSFQMQTDKNFECNRLLQVGSFTGCIFAKAPFGVFVGDWTTNIANFYNCRFEDHRTSALVLNGAECVNFFGGRFEGGGDPRSGTATIDLAKAAAVNFHGVYFEGTHPILLRETRSRNGVTFTGCHFTGSANPGGSPGAYRFESDGIVNFGPNDWGAPSPGPVRTAVFGANAGLVGAGRQYDVRTPGAWHIRSEQVHLAANSERPVVVATRVVTAGANGAVCTTGTLKLTRVSRRPDGGVALARASFDVIVTAISGRPITLELAATTNAPTPLRVRVGAIAADRATIVASAADGVDGTLRWTLEAEAVASDAGQRLDLDFP